MGKAKKILFVLTKAPHAGAYTYEALDIIMTAAAFDQDVSVLLLGDAVFSIKAKQQVDAGVKDTAAMFAVLPIYNVQTIFVETESLQENGLIINDLSEAVVAIPRQNIGEFVRQFDLIL